MSVTEDALARMPHKGTMLLIERVERMEAGRISCLARDHCTPDYPLRVGSRLMSVALVELGAQAAAAHASVHGIAGAHTGLLLSLRGVEVLLAEADGIAAPLAIEAGRIETTEAGAHYRFTIEGEGRKMLKGEAMLSMQAVGR
ncbi:MAG: hydroxymyristoyl-ACP dehydratase [Pseudomonadota bacterium]